MRARTNPLSRKFLEDRGISGIPGMLTVFEAKEYYEDLGFSVIPLVPGGKLPLFDLPFSKLQPDYPWTNSSANANIGIRCGGRNASLCWNVMINISRVHMSV